MDHSNCSFCMTLWRRQPFVLLRSLSRITPGLILNFSYNECVVVRARGKFPSPRNQNFQIVGVTNVVSSQAMRAIPLPTER